MAQTKLDSAALFTPCRAARVEGGFWRRLLEINCRSTLPAIYRHCQETGRLDAFRLAWQPGQPKPPHIFWDSDVAKWLEAACYNLAIFPDSAQARRIDEAIEAIASAQQSDGYLNTHFTVVEPTKRWVNLRDNHELYCAGHLIEAAVAHFEATGKRRLLDVACRYADYLAQVFGRQKGQRRGYCGHEEIELALIRLFRATGENKHLELAKYFVDERGRQPHYFDLEARARGEDPSHYVMRTYEYNQSHAPVREQTEVVGHAVRAMYLYCAMADLAALTADQELWTACQRLWNDLAMRKMHITGGIGPAAANEGFTCAYDLPSEGAYLETCAAIGLALWAHRMLQLSLDRQYADVMERALYNGVLSGLSADGAEFFYGNPLAAYPGFDGNGRFIKEGYHYRRSPWFDCSCCPGNLSRVIGQAPRFLYAASAKTLAVHLYAQSQVTCELGGQAVTLLQKTDYPWDGEISLKISAARPAAWTLALRIPAWCREPRLRINGKPAPLKMRQGYAHIRQTWREGDSVQLLLPMSVERMVSHPAARHLCGRVALQRGPLVYCLEETDNGKYLNDISLPVKTRFNIGKGCGVLAGIPIIRCQAWRSADVRRKELYQKVSSRRKQCQITAIPYFLWANRKPGEMIVWIRQERA